MLALAFVRLAPDWRVDRKGALDLGR